MAKVRRKSWGDLAQPGVAGVADDSLEEGLRRDRSVADEDGFRDGPQHVPRVDAVGGGQSIESVFGPGRHRDSADTAVLNEGLY